MGLGQPRGPGTIDGRFHLFRIVARAIKRSMAGINYSKPSGNTGGALGFEATLWATADKLRGNLDAAEYKHVVLGLIFLKYISDAFEEQHAELQKEKGADPEDRDEYTADNIFWVPPEARCPTARPRQRPGHRQVAGQRHDRHRARQSLAQRRFAQGIRPPASGQAKSRRRH